MSFCPDTQDLVKYHRADAQGLVLFLGPLDRNAHKTDIEDAIRTIPECCGHVTVCWQGVVPQRRPRRQEQRQNPGWCHILCTNMEVKDCVLGVLNNQQLIGSSRQAVTIARAKKPIVYWAHMTPIVAQQPAPSMPEEAQMVEDTVPAVEESENNSAILDLQSTAFAALARVAADFNSRLAFLDVSPLED
ncbi:hypothetical protein NPX13_g9437 [Xylaria arbuscula]|uniref:Uncharacterized protein n=1 Tax=Xylaria arbuscula TaxID=114810 RepID=A0A9W8TJ17_9PEZI|nr:hypothetical protein NPX13_g9437 [Xylaria arbuscula]